MRYDTHESPQKDWSIFLDAQKPERKSCNHNTATTMKIVRLALWVAVAVFTTDPLVVATEEKDDEFAKYLRKKDATAIDQVEEEPNSQGGEVALLRSSQNRRRVEAQRELQVGVRPQLPLIEVVSQAFVLRLMEAYLGFARLVPEVSGTGPFTLFPPWDNAFERLPAALVNRLQSRPWVAHLQNLLRYHIYNGDLPLSTLPATTTITMQNGETAVVTRTPGTTRVRVNGILAIADYDANNGTNKMKRKRELVYLAWSYLVVFSRFVS